MIATQWQWTNLWQPFQLFFCRGNLYHCLRTFGCSVLHPRLSAFTSGGLTRSRGQNFAPFKLLQLHKGGKGATVLKSEPTWASHFVHCSKKQGQLCFMWSVTFYFSKRRNPYHNGCVVAEITKNEQLVQHSEHTAKLYLVRKTLKPIVSLRPILRLICLPFAIFNINLKVV